MSFEVAVVVVDEAAHARLVPISIFAEGEGFSHQIRTALAQGVVEAFDMRCLATLFSDTTMPFAREHARIRLPEVTIADRPFAIIGPKRLPQLATGLGSTVAKGEPDDATRLPF